MVKAESVTDDEAHACPNCEGVEFINGSCTRCRRPIQAAAEYTDEVEGLAWDVVNSARDEY